MRWSGNLGFRGYLQTLFLFDSCLPTASFFLLDQKEPKNHRKINDLCFAWCTACATRTCHTKLQVHTEFCGTMPNALGCVSVRGRPRNVRTRNFVGMQEMGFRATNKISGWVSWCIFFDSFLLCKQKKWTPPAGKEIGKMMVTIQIKLKAN